jgi:hypothetical protein
VASGLSQVILQWRDFVATDTNVPVRHEGTAVQLSVYQGSLYSCVRWLINKAS